MFSSFWWSGQRSCVLRFTPQGFFFPLILPVIVLCNRTQEHTRMAQNKHDLARLKHEVFPSIWTCFTSETMHYTSCWQLEAIQEKKSSLSSHSSRIQQVAFCVTLGFPLFSFTFFWIGVGVTSEQSHRSSTAAPLRQIYSGRQISKKPFESLHAFEHKNVWFDICRTYCGNLM